MFAPESRARLFIMIAILLAATFGALTWRGIRDERQRVAFRTCFYADDAARLLQAKTRLHLEAMAAPLFAAVGGRAPVGPTERLPPPAVLKTVDQALAKCHCAPRLSAQAYFRIDLDASGAVSRLAIERADWATSRSGGDAASPSVTPGAIDSTRIAEAVGRLRFGPRDAGVVIAAGVTRSVADTDVLDAIAVMSPRYGIDGRRRAWYGVIVSPIAFTTEVIVPVFDSQPVFSSMLRTVTARGVRFPLGPFPNRSLANLAVLDEHWATLYQTGPMTDTVTSHFVDPGTEDNYESPGCVGMSATGPTMAALVFLVSPTMPVYNQWIENGLVASYVPSLGVILAAMVASMAAAILFARREAELARLRSDFVSNVSHEMRMPLAQILLSGETLQLGRTRSQAEYNGEADSIVREAHRLAGFVDNVLSFSRIEHNNVQVTPQPIDLCGVVDETIATARTLANGRAVTVTSTIARDVDAFVDPDALRQVLYNLLENAIKYGPVGQRIIVGAAPSTTVADRIEVWVDDEGPGVPVHATSAVFEPFVRLDRDRDAGIAGSGLGLAVVRFIIEQHGGRVRIEPGSRGRGTRFVIEIPATGPSC